MTAGELRITKAAGERAVTVADADGAPWCTLRLGVPGADVPGWEPGDGELVLARSDDVETRARLFRDIESWTLSLSADNRRDAPVGLPELGVAVAPADGVVGWSWSSDLEGFVALAPDDRRGPVVVLRLRQGFLRAARSSLAFCAPPGPGLAFHLCPPHGRLGAYRRHQASLVIETYPRLADVGALLPAWLPDVVGDVGEGVEFRTPDEGVVGGDGVAVSVVDTAAVATLDHAGHGTVTLHGARGVRRVGISAAPRLEQLVPPLVEVVKARRPSVRTSGAGLFVAEALARGLVVDDEVALDWLEREDWLARGDLESVAIASVLAAATSDASLLHGAWAVLTGLAVQPGFGLVAMKLGLTSVGLLGGASPEAQELLARPAADDLARLELALVMRRNLEDVGPQLDGVVNALGDMLPGQSLGLSARDAALRISLLRLCPEAWELRTRGRENRDRSALAARCADKAQRLLLADEAEREQPDVAGLAWLLLGELGV